MPRYDYKCAEHGYFERSQSIAERKSAPCPECGADSKQVILTAPAPLIEAMANAGCPGAFHTSGDRITRRHRKAGQYHNSSDDVAAEAKAIDAEMTYASTTTSPTP
jgi:putative FmdB family regulatory protein